MNPKNLIIAGLVAGVACRTSIPRDVHWHYAILAWNEDTVHKYYIALMQDKTFYYTIEEPKPNGEKEIDTWRGYLQPSGDTIYLHFLDRKQPPMCDFLLREASGSYLIQYFRNGQPRMFLRKQRSSGMLR